MSYSEYPNPKRNNNIELKELLKAGTLFCPELLNKLFSEG